jgi:CBS domain-containing protein
MRTRDYYRTEVATAGPDASAADLADLMARYAVGCVVIVDAEERAVGIVTDRDLACRVIAKGLEDTARAGDVMSRPLLTASPSDRIESVIERMRTAGVRRLPVVRDGRLTGLVAIDDLLVELGRELDDLGEAARRAVESARKRSRRERRRHDLEETITDLRASVERAGREAGEFLVREYEALRERLRRSSGPPDTQ